MSAMGSKSSVPLKVGVLTGWSLLLLPVAGPANADTWKAEMQLDRTRSAGICLKGAENTYTLDLSGSTLTGKASINSFRAKVAADGTVRDDFLAELDQGLNSTVTTKLQKFTITGNAQTRDLELAWPASACIWKLKPRS